MLVFFYAKENLKTNITQESNIVYEHEFRGVTDEEENSQIPLDKIYLTTPNDFGKHRKYLELSKQDPNLLRAINPKDIVESQFLPKNITFKNIDEELGDLKQQQELKIAILNGMSNAIGDHLIGMNALNLLHEHLQRYYDKRNINITLFQLNPARLNPITDKWSFTSKTYILPTTLAALSTFDLFYDFGGLLALKGFQDLNMIDFFLNALSINAESVAAERKRIQFYPSEMGRDTSKMLMRQVRKKAGKKPIMLFHNKSTSPIRSMDNKNAERIIRDIVKESDYFVISAIDTGFKCENFMNLHKFSREIDQFASIISLVDAIVTVDTCTYHFADSFNIPTIALFSSIAPELRCKYYPLVKGVLLCKKDSILYGNHKFELNEDKSNQELVDQASEETAKIWKRLTAKRILRELSKIT